MPPRFQIESLTEQNLPEAAEYLESTRRADPAAGKFALAHNTKEKLLNRLRWSLLKNPARREGLELGQCLRADHGELAGVNLQIPARFLHGQRRLLGLCGGSFFVDAAARLQGYFMFRRFMSTPGADFVFATSCNPSSAALWQRLDGSPLPDSRFESYLPLRYGPLAREVLLRRGCGRLLAGLGAAAGALATPLLARRTLEPFRNVSRCEDWNHLASLAERHRDPNKLTADRNAEFLRWRYSDAPAAGQKRVYCFENEQGDEGWFALHALTRGQELQIRSEVLMDLVIPRTGVDFARLAATLVNICTPGADMIALFGPSSRWPDFERFRIRRREFEQPMAYIRAGDGQTQSLASAAALVPADGDALD